MNKTDKVEFNIEVSAADATEEDIDRMTRQLLSELRNLAVESAQLAEGGPIPNRSTRKLLATLEKGKQKI